MDLYSLPSDKKQTFLEPTTSVNLINITTVQMIKNICKKGSHFDKSKLINKKGFAIKKKEVENLLFA